MNIMEELSHVLKGKQFRREHPERSLNALKQLGAENCTSVRSFYDRYRGPIGSNVMGYQLLDIVEDDPSILTATTTIRQQFDLDPGWLVISDLLANAVLLYNTRTDEVFDVDFESGIELLKANRLKSKWQTFDSFLRAFFQIELR